MESVTLYTVLLLKIDEKIIAQNILTIKLHQQLLENYPINCRPSYMDRMHKQIATIFYSFHGSTSTGFREIVARIFPYDEID